MIAHSLHLQQVNKDEMGNSAYLGKEKVLVLRVLSIGGNNLLKLSRIFLFAALRSSASRFLYIANLD